MPVTDAMFEALKERVNLVELHQAVKSATDEAIEGRLTKIENALSRLTWLMISGIGMALIAFVVGGGFSNVAT